MLTAYNVYLGKYWDGEWFRTNRAGARPYTFTKYRPKNTVLVKTKF